MRYRKLDENGDYSFGNGQGDFWRDAVEGVAQSVVTRLRLFTGEWFLDPTEGTAWGGFPINDEVVRQGRILGEHTLDTRDLELQTRIVSTPGVTELDDYESSLDGRTRVLRVTGTMTVSATLETIYGRVSVDVPVDPGYAPPM